MTTILGAGSVSGDIVVWDSGDASWEAFQIPAVSICRPSDYTNFPNASETTVDFTSSATVEYNVGAMWAVATYNVLIAKVAGIYNVHAVVTWEGAAGGRRELNLYKNGSTLVGKARNEDVTTSIMLPCEVNTQIALAANDYLGLKAYQNSGAAIDLLYADRGVNFSMVWLRPAV